MNELRNRGAVQLKPGAQPATYDLLVPGSLVQSAQNALQHLGDPLPNYVKRDGTAGARASSYFHAFFWAPYVGVEKGGVRWHWMPFVLGLFVEYFLSFMVAITVPAMASYASGTQVNLNAFTVAITYALVMLFGQSWRTAHYLPHYLMPSLTFADVLHTHIGLLVGVSWMGMQLLGALTSAPVLAALGSTIVPDFTAGAPNKPISYWGAVCLQTLLQTFVVYAWQFNTTFKHRHIINYDDNRTKGKRNRHRAFHATSIFFALAIFISVVVSYGNGLWSVGNWVVTFGSYTNTGTWNTPDGVWTLDCIWWLAAGAVGWLAGLLTWNVDALTEQEILDIISSEESGAAAMSSAGGDDVTIV